MGEPRPLPYPFFYHDLRHITQGLNALVATGTGSGKTESFLIPILNHLLGERLHLGLLAQSVQLSMVGLLLVLLVQNLPLLFKGTDQLVALRVGHQELLAVLFVLLLNLHLSD